MLVDLLIPSLTTAGEGGFVVFQHYGRREPYRRPGAIGLHANDGSLAVQHERRLQSPKRWKFDRDLDRGSWHRDRVAQYKYAALADVPGYATTFSPASGIRFPSEANGSHYSVSFHVLGPLLPYDFSYVLR